MKIVEFGVNQYPVFVFLPRVEKEIQAGATYVGFDIDESAIREAPQGHGKHFALADMGKIPLGDSIADEIWVLNVFGGDFRNLPEKHADGLFVWEPSLNRHFREMARILKPGGKIYIGEWLPRMNDPSRLKDEDYSAFGLTKKLYEAGNLLEFISQHGFRSFIIDRGTSPFVIELTKNTRWST